ncbi:MAG: hypothetical protein AAFP81_16880 [Pseudomonadota bacterium]
MSKNGGKREGAGRKPGSLNKRTIELQERAAEMGVCPAEAMLHNIKWAQDQLTAMENTTLAALVESLDFSDNATADRLAEVAKNFPLIKELREIIHKNAKDVSPYLLSKLATVHLEGTGDNGEVIFKTVYESK